MDYENAYDKIYKYTYFRVRDRATAEDITQETFLRFLAKYGTLREGDIRCLYTIAGNLCIDEYRRVKPEPLPEEDSGSLFAVPDSSEDTAIIRAALSELSPEDRELLLLRHVNGEAVGTIAKIMNLSRFAVRRRLQAAEENLRKRLEVDA